MATGLNNASSATSTLHYSGVLPCGHQNYFSIDDCKHQLGRVVPAADIVLKPGTLSTSEVKCLCSPSMKKAATPKLKKQWIGESTIIHASWLQVFIVERIQSLHCLDISRGKKHGYIDTDAI